VFKAEWRKFCQITPYVVGIVSSGARLYPSLNSYEENVNRFNNGWGYSEVAEYTKDRGPGKLWSKKDALSTNRDFLEVVGNMYETPELLDEEFDRTDNVIPPTAEETDEQSQSSSPKTL